MKPEQIQQLALTVLEKMKALDITTIDVHELTHVMDYIIVCTGTSSRHTRSIAQSLVTEAKANGLKPFGVEGLEYGEWVLIDLGDVVVHIMLEQARSFYGIEKLWTMTEKKRAPHAN